MNNFVGLGSTGVSLFTDFGLAVVVFFLVAVVDLAVVVFLVVAFLVEAAFLVNVCFWQQLFQLWFLDSW